MMAVGLFCEPDFGLIFWFTADAYAPSPKR